MMRTQKPVKQLHRTVSKLFNQDPDPDPFTLRRLRKEAEELQGEDSVTTSLVLARLACMECQPSAMETYYKQLINHNPNHPQTHLEYALSLRKLGYYADARKRSLKAMEIDPEHPGIEQQIMRDCILCGHFLEAGEHLKAAIRASKPIFRAQFHFLEGVQELLKQHQWTDEMVSAIPQQAADLLHEHHLYPTGILRAPAVHIVITTDGEYQDTPSSSSAWLRWRIHVNTTEEQLHSLNQTLNQRIDLLAGLPEAPLQHIDLQLAPWRDEAIYNHPYGFYM
ncbi:tetratricopeptide repeat protein [Magnetococcus sp. PR-3]|uniref:tetratricopeptide repeat protein n=1 Tax=Magnetococcus sp. PR-3 TaxID=3120355 RepID=UPI002FCE4303